MLQLAFHPDLAVHVADEPRRDGQAETGAAVFPGRGAIHLAEWLEDQPLLRGGYADAAVPDGEVERGAAVSGGFAVHLDPDKALAGEFDRVPEQIQQHLAEARGIAEQRVGDIGIDVPAQIQTLARGVQRDGAGGARHRFAQREGFLLGQQTAGFDLREIQDVVDDPQKRLGGAFHGLQIIALVGGQGCVAG